MMAILSKLQCVKRTNMLPVSQSDAWRVSKMHRIQITKHLKNILISPMKKIPSTILKVYMIKSMAYCQTVVTPLLTHWCYYSLALSHRNDNVMTSRDMKTFTRRQNKKCFSHTITPVIKQCFVCMIQPMTSSLPKKFRDHHNSDVNERQGVSNHWQLHCLCNSTFMTTTKKRSELRINDPLCQCLLITWQRVTNTESAFISWRHHDT